VIIALTQCGSNKTCTHWKPSVVVRKVFSWGFAETFPFLFWFAKNLMKRKVYIHCCEAVDMSQLLTSLSLSLTHTHKLSVSLSPLHRVPPKEAWKPFIFPLSLSHCWIKHCCLFFSSGVEESPGNVMNVLIWLASVFLLICSTAEAFVFATARNRSFQPKSMHS
jgi:hypothetical protein